MKSRIAVLFAVVVLCMSTYPQDPIYYSRETCCKHAYIQHASYGQENCPFSRQEVYNLDCPFCKREQISERGPSGNCFKCSGKGQLGTWCTFCHGFMASCIHGCSWRTCDACSGIGWIETQFQRCFHCGGKGYDGTWCTFCHGFMIWCTHGCRWQNCCACAGKGYISSEYTACGTCGAKGWVGRYCSFCYGTMMWCIHGVSPSTCYRCGGKGIVKK